VGLLCVMVKSPVVVTSRARKVLLLVVVTRVLGREMAIKTGRSRCLVAISRLKVVGEGVVVKTTRRNELFLVVDVRERKATLAAEFVVVERIHVAEGIYAQVVVVAIVEGEAIASEFVTTIVAHVVQRLSGKADLRLTEVLVNINGHGVSVIKVSCVLDGPLSEQWRIELAYEVLSAVSTDTWREWRDRFSKEKLAQ
jgi:hypothetical protein